MSDDADTFDDVDDAESATPAVPAELPSFIVGELLTVRRCPTCGELFAVRAELLGDWTRTLHCPAGHTFAAIDGGGDLRTSTVAARLRQATADADQLRTLMATQLKPTDEPCDDVELARRIEHYVRQANLGGGGRYPCRLCGRHYERRDYLRRHVKQTHVEQIRRMSPAAFC